MGAQEGRGQTGCQSRARSAAIVSAYTHHQVVVARLHVGFAEADLRSDGGSGAELGAQDHGEEQECDGEVLHGGRGRAEEDQLL